MAESNQCGKRNKNHMNPLTQLKKATPLFVIALVLACFALSPQAFATGEPTISPNSYCCRRPQRSVPVHFSSTISGGKIKVECVPPCAGSVLVANPTTTPVPCQGKALRAAHTSNNGATLDSGWTYTGIYKYKCPGSLCALTSPVGIGVLAVVTIAVLIAVLIAILRRVATGRISVR